MNYYSIYLPIQTDLSQIIYSSDADIPIGARVIVNFNRQIMTGICGQSVSACELHPKVKYKPVSEIIDTSALVPDDLLKLALWISRYYRCSTGKALFAMLPSVIMPEIATHIKWIGSETFENRFQEFYNLLCDRQFHQVKAIKPAFANKPFYKLLEMAETNGLIELKRGFDSKVKPKTVNYLKQIFPPVLPALTTKQADALSILSQHPAEFPLSTVTDEISYAIIKALVQKGLLQIIPRQVENRAIIFPEYSQPKQIILTAEQNAIITQIAAGLGQHEVHLLYGITGSGKTEVYIEIIQSCLQMGKNALMLIPEIALTPQMVDRFFGAFGSTIAILHSQLTDRQRYEQWQSIRKGECRIVIGARSAVFAPLANLGVIIVDEEHEQSYKQDNVPRYNGRDMAIVRAKQAGATVILGSATPSLESWYNAQQGRYRLHRLTTRPTPQGLPEVLLLDMKEEEGTDLLSQTLRDAIEACLTNGEQVILMHNRRGFSSFVQCLKCGVLQQCPHCEISLYYHHDREEMMCHYCGYHIPSPRKCPDCGSYTFAFGAPGTQKIEQLLSMYFPTAKVLRVDSDSSRKKDTYNYMYAKMRSREIDILLGTQMISKGLDFPHVTLVGVILADISLNVPDFRSGERTFNLLTQVAGRSGRGDKPGRVIIQTWNPEHYAIAYAVQQNFKGFAAEELQYRQRLCYPPFFRLARFLFSSEDQKTLLTMLDKCFPAIDKIRQSYLAADLLLLGPSPAPLSMINNFYRHHLIIKAKDVAILSQVIQKLEKIFQLPARILLSIDIDPLSLM